jgi:hypothetical protein
MQEVTKGSTTAFVALHRAMLSKNRVAIARFQPRETSTVRIAALVAQVSCYNVCSLLFAQSFIGLVVAGRRKNWTTTVANLLRQVQIVEARQSPVFVIDSPLL